MKLEQAKANGYTHHGKMYGTWLNDKMLTFFIWIEQTFNFNEAFPIHKGAKL